MVNHIQIQPCLLSIYSVLGALWQVLCCENSSYQVEKVFAVEGLNTQMDSDQSTYDNRTLTQNPWGS